jgi:hypothetical protein
MSDALLSDAGPADIRLREILLMELSRQTEAPDGSKITLAALIARKLVDLALAGDLRAIKEIFDRVDAKPQSGVRMERPRRPTCQPQPAGSSTRAVNATTPARDKRRRPGDASGTAKAAPPQRLKPLCPAVPLVPPVRFRLGVARACRVWRRRPEQWKRLICRNEGPPILAERSHGTRPACSGPSFWPNEPKARDRRSGPSSWPNEPNCTGSRKGAWGQKSRRCRGMKGRRGILAERSQFTPQRSGWS